MRLALARVDRSGRAVEAGGARASDGVVERQVLVGRPVAADRVQPTGLRLEGVAVRGRAAGRLARNLAGAIEAATAELRDKAADPLKLAWDLWRLLVILGEK